MIAAFESLDRSGAQTYTTKEYANSISAALASLDGREHDVVAKLMTRNSGAVSSNPDAIAQALDIDHDGYLVGSERRPIWPLVDLAAYARLRDGMGSPTEAGIGMQMIADGQLGTGSSAGDVAAMQFELAQAFGMDPTSTIDWSQVAATAERTLAQRP
jgi:hypothetical protein